MFKKILNRSLIHDLIKKIINLKLNIHMIMVVLIRTISDGYFNNNTNQEVP